ncbi:alkaline phosphatase D family protein [Arenibaculum sp.]|jgi:hypothetical protein|uniref:alkaline phosphatase D family protein n=1 Tax=Arenibaculum sp. TaxID=2865862 RepID=UPI002E144198|nr:alkaline phosphatase D family protein [Arenibaculum sp.]
MAYPITRRRDIAPLLGPVLHFRGTGGGDWHASALYVLERGDEPPPALTVDGGPPAARPRHLARHRDRDFWIYDFSVPQDAGETRVGYGLAGGERHYVAVPGLSEPPRFAFASCNGAEDEGAFAQPGFRNARWAHLFGRHRTRPYHLLLHGGDQLYADAVWTDCPSLVAWRSLPARDRLTAPFTPSMAEQVEDFYVGLYLRLWRQPEIAALLASVPSVMMWDDHDIFDGWGSHPEDRLDSPVFRGVYGVARQCFSLFQVAMDPAVPAESCWGAGIGTFTQGFRMGGVGLLALDLRSERRPDRILSERSWSELPRWLDRLSGVRHLLLMSGVPLAFVNLNAVERLANALPGQMRLEDDLRDQWRSYAHEGEWLRLLRLLGDHAVRRRVRVTVLSGEVHLGYSAVIRGPGHQIWQLTSSGIAHPAPSRVYVEILERLARGVETIRDGLTIEMVPLPGSGRHFIRMRNWLEILFRDDGALAAQWHVEGETDRLVRIVPPPPRPEG